MSTNDVPGFKQTNNDVLHGGCWAEHEDGSLILVWSTEDQMVIYEMFDHYIDPPAAYRDAMPIGDFYKAFSWDSKNMVNELNGGRKVPNEKWTWHDKTPFPFDRLIDADILTKGPVPISAKSQLSAASRVAESLQLRAQKLDADSYKDRLIKSSSIVMSLKDKFSRAFGELRK